VITFGILVPQERTRGTLDSIRVAGFYSCPQVHLKLTSARSYLTGDSDGLSYVHRASFIDLDSIPHLAGKAPHATGWLFGSQL